MSLLLLPLLSLAAAAQAVEPAGERPPPWEQLAPVATASILDLPTTGDPDGVLRFDLPVRSFTFTQEDYERYSGMRHRRLFPRLGVARELDAVLRFAPGARELGEHALRVDGAPVWVPAGTMGPRPAR
jgi:hypothetical protein